MSNSPGRKGTKTAIQVRMTLISAALLLGGANTPGAWAAVPDDEVTGETLLRLCARLDTRSQDKCEGYMDAAFETARSGIALLETQAGREPWNACVPGQIDKRLRRGFVLAYLGGRPRWRKLPLSTMVRLALLHAYPCD